MRRLRSFVALFSALAVMACQTAAAVGSAAMPAPLTSVSAVQSADRSIPSAVAKSETAAPSPAAASSSKRKTILIVAVLAAVIVAAVLISSGDGGGY